MAVDSTGVSVALMAEIGSKTGTATCSYDANGFDTTYTPKATTFTPGKSFTAASDPGWSSEGYVGWNTRADGNGRFISAEESVAFHASITLYAEKGYLITFNADSESGTDAKWTDPETGDTTTTKTAYVRYGTTFTAPEVNYLTRGSDVFQGFYSQDGTQYIDSSNVGVLA